MGKKKHFEDKNQLKLDFEICSIDKKVDEYNRLEDKISMESENEELSRKYNIQLDDSKEIDWHKDYLGARGHKFNLEINEIKVTKTQDSKENVGTSLKLETRSEKEFDYLDFVENKLKEFAGVDNLDDMCYLRDSIIEAPYVRRKTNLDDYIYETPSLKYFLNLFRFLEKSERSKLFNFLNELIIEYNDEDESSGEIESDY